MAITLIAKRIPIDGKCNKDLGGICDLVGQSGLSICVAEMDKENLDKNPFQEFKSSHDECLRSNGDTPSSSYMQCKGAFLKRLRNTN